MSLKLDSPVNKLLIWLLPYHPLHSIPFFTRFMKFDFLFLKLVMQAWIYSFPKILMNVASWTITRKASHFKTSSGDRIVTPIFGTKTRNMGSWVTNIRQSHHVSLVSPCCSSFESSANNHCSSSKSFFRSMDIPSNGSSFSSSSYNP